MTGEQLAQIMSVLCLTQDQVAEACLYTRAAVKSWIKRNQEIPEPATRRLLTYFIQTLNEKTKEFDTLRQIFALMV